jgi:hypothetical protein
MTFDEHQLRTVGADVPTSPCTPNAFASYDAITRTTPATDRDGSPRNDRSRSCSTGAERIEVGM